MKSNQDDLRIFYPRNKSTQVRINRKLQEQTMELLNELPTKISFTEFLHRSMEDFIENHKTK